ncbi:uncharacterized protein [Nothobranchius furzeri]|uniref:Si:ch73-134f24.1 n=2 Tax=Nothobranchius furzeri TaxID=105023 RepID=A0A1A8UP94_NOTFU|nr:uncharacterized protein LOC129153650 [Nothobranchius furzeri]XP_054589563.1 uncharacterized protein LOC129153650 [Nothobranchius furzeri]XP_054599334.1 uncharacterized protein LOC129163974 [Nothobranchius furzeri]
MEQTVRFRILIDDQIKKVTLSSGVPSTVAELVAAVKENLSIPTDISLQYKDEDFGDFFTVTSTNELKDKDTLKVVYAPICLDLTVADQESNCDVSVMSSFDSDSASGSLDSQDTVILSQSTFERQNPWPAVFPIPTFSHNTELALKQGNETYLKEGTPMTSPGFRSDILERLAEAMFSYTAYPDDAQRSAVAQALVEKHPCLKEPGSFNGIYGWQQSLKYKCGNYRTKRRALGSPELLINSLSQKPGDEQEVAKNIKKAKRAELNYLPPHPPGETDDTLENMRLEIITASKRKDCGKDINYLMTRTYSLRRKEVVSQSPRVTNFMERWPALFDTFQINAEFQRCTAVPLQSTFMSQLDKCTPKLLDLFSAKGGAVGQRIKNLLMELIQDTNVSTVQKRDVTLRCLIEYMGESGQELISDYYGSPETSVHEDLKLRSMMIYICHDPDAVGIIIEGVPVLTNLGSLAKACSMLLGLTYALNLQYPTKLVKTFEVFQRLFVGLDTLRPKPSSRYMTLKNKLLT